MYDIQLICVWLNEKAFFNKVVYTSTVKFLSYLLHQASVCSTSPISRNSMYNRDASAPEYIVRLSSGGIIL